MWQRFTERARRVIFFSQEEAARLQESYISTEHILLGLLRENDTVAARILHILGVSLDSIRQELERQVVGGTTQTGADLQLTPRAKQVVDFAYDEARELSNNYIGTEHLLLGLIREEEGLAGRVLRKLGITLDATQDVIWQLQHSEGRQESKPPEFPRGSYAQAVTAVQAFTFGMDSQDWELAAGQFGGTADVDLSALGGPNETLTRQELQAHLKEWRGKSDVRTHTTLGQSFPNPRQPGQFLFYYTAQYFQEPAGNDEHCTVYGWYHCQMIGDEIAALAVTVTGVIGQSGLLHA